LAPTPEHADLLVIGGGINGAAVARDGAGRGLRVVLAERNDYASATSSASSKLIHGGLRYLEHFEFSLVRESLRERETMLRIAPHLTRPLRFLLPITAGQSRPAWMVWLGLKLYDALSGRQLLARSGRLSRDEVVALPRLRKEHLRAVLHYPDCWVDDARLVLETLLDARTRGADIANRREVTTIAPAENGYIATLKENGHERSLHARFVVNTAGPWANQVLEHSDIDLPSRKLRLVRGSHVVLAMPQPAVTTAFTLQNSDGRVVFTIPWLDGRFLVIGTTDQPQTEDPATAYCSDQERDYLLDCYNLYFDHPGGPAGAHDIVWTWAGVRALVDDGRDDPSKVTRSARFIATRNGAGGFVTVYGGKLTTHRRLAEKIMRRLARMGAMMGGEWTASAALHGGDLPRRQLEELAAKRPPGLSETLARRWAFTYGSETMRLYDAIASEPALAKEIARGICEAELRHAGDVEDARNAEDFLYRRTKMFLDINTRERRKIEQWFSCV